MYIEIRIHKDRFKIQGRFKDFQGHISGNLSLK